MSTDPRCPRDRLPLGGDTMSPAMASASNYYSWIASEFRPVLGERVLDIGGGHGAHLEHIVSKQRYVVSVDLSPECVREMQERFSGERFTALCGDITEPSFRERLAAERFDTIVCVNVLEHIEKDAEAIQAMAAILRHSCGRLFLFVPAHPFLYGTPDSLAGHFRRYRRRDLQDLLAAAGLQQIRTRYFNWFGALPYLVNSRILRPRSLGGSVDSQIVLFDRYCVPVLRRVEPWFPFPFGQSLVATARVGDR